MAIGIRFPMAGKQLYTPRVEMDKAVGGPNREVAAASGAGRCVRINAKRC